MSPTASDDTHHGGLALSVPSYECDLLSPLDLHCGVAEHDLSGISCRQVFALEHDVSGTGSWRELHGQTHVVGLVYLYAVELLEGLDARLHLVRLSGLVAERLDELLGLLYHLLLVLVGGGLLLYPLGAKFEVFRVRHLVVVDMTEHDLHRAVGDVVEEAPVVAYEQQRAACRLQVVFEPFYGLYVEVVRGLVEQQHVRLAKQDLGELYAHVPALRECLGVARELGVLESEAEQGPSRLHLRRLAVAYGEPVVERGEPFDQARILFRLIVAAVSELGGDALYLLFYAGVLVEHAHCLLQHAEPLVVLHYLRQVSYPYVGGHVYASRGRALLPAYHLEYRGLACPVLAYEAYLVVVAYVETDAVEQDEPAVCDRNSFQ